MTEMKKRRQGTNKLPFGRILKELMEQRGLTIRAVSEMAGVSTSVVQSWINQANPHDLRAIARLAGALGVSFKSLLLGENENRNETVMLTDFFDEHPLFEGICRLSIQKLEERKR